LCAASSGAPHIRQRLWWVAHSHLPRQYPDCRIHKTSKPRNNPWRRGTDGRLPYTHDEPCDRAGFLSGDDCGERQDPQCVQGVKAFWSDYELIPCIDGKARRIEPGLAPLVDGLPGRVGLLRGYGNAIVPQVGAQFIEAFMEFERR